jgi:hypothetical protein
MASGSSDYGITDAALEQRIAELSDTDFNSLMERTRPPRPGETMSRRQVELSVARKTNELAARNRERAQQRQAEKHAPPSTPS